MGSIRNRMITTLALLFGAFSFGAPEPSAAVESEPARAAAPAATAASIYAVRLSPYDPLAKRYAARYDLDWRLLTAVMSAESAFEPNAESFAGAVGLMQLMPPTAADMGVANVHRPEQNVHAGAKYLRWLHARFESVPAAERLNFVVAAYNAGPGHVRDAQRLAAWLGWDPNLWTGSVERAILLLERPENYAYARYGYCRGSETVAYVARVRTVHATYVGITDWADAFFAGRERSDSLSASQSNLS